MTQNLYKLIQDQWASYNAPFRTFRDNYNAYYEAERVKQNSNILPFRKWKVNENTEEQKLWQTMNKKAWEIGRVLLDGVYFRSSKVQNQKRTKSDNSCIVANVNVDERQTSRQRNATVSRNVTCYGIIQTLFALHVPSFRNKAGGSYHKDKI